VEQTHVRPYIVERRKNGFPNVATTIWKHNKKKTMIIDGMRWIVKSSFKSRMDQNKTNQGW